MRNNRNTPFIVQKSAHMLSVRLYQTSNSMNSVVITGMPKVLSSSSLPTPQQWSMNQTINLLRRPLLSVAYSLPCSYPPETRCTIVPIPGSAHIPGMGAHLLLANAPRQRTALIFPFLTIKTAPMPRVIDLLFVPHRNRIRCQARTSSPHLREVLGDRLSLVMDLLRDRTPVLILPSCLQTVRVHTVLISAGGGLFRVRRSPNHVQSSPPHLSARVPSSMIDFIVAPPAHPLMVAPVLMDPLNGRDQTYTETPHELMIGRPQNGSSQRRIQRQVS